MDPVRVLLRLADDLEQRGYPFVGTLRQAAREVATGPRVPEGGCRGCGAPLPYCGRGRRRVWCSERCRRRRRP